MILLTPCGIAETTIALEKMRAQIMERRLIDTKIPIVDLWKKNITILKSWHGNFVPSLEFNLIINPIKIYWVKINCPLF